MKLSKMNSESFYKFLSVMILSAICMLITQHASAQEYQWTLKQGGTLQDLPHTAQVDPKSNDLFLSGSIKGTVDMDPGAGTTNLSSTNTDNPATYIARYTSAGALVWAKKFNENGVQDLVVTKILIDTSGYFYLTGTFSGTQNFNVLGGTTNLGNTGIVGSYLVKYRSSDAKLMWAKCIARTSFNMMGADIAVPLDADITDNGKIFLVGGVVGIADYDPSSGTNNIGSPDATANYFIKYDTAGTLDFVKFITGAAQSSDLKLTSNNEVYISGILPGPSDFDPSSSTYTISPGTEGAYAGFFAKYDEYGNFTWAKKIDTDGTNVLFTHILLDESENPILYGNFNGTADFDPSSNQKKFTSKGSSDAYFAKYNSSGKLSWVKTIGSTGYELICGLTLEKDNSLIALLNYSNTIPVDVDPGNGVQMTTTNNEHTFVHFSSTGQYLSFAEFGAHWITPSGIVHDTLNGVYLISVITGNNVDMDPGVGTATFSTLGYEDIIVSKYSTASIIASTFDKKEEVPFKAYPIPASQSITVELPANLKFCQARILNLYGQVLWEGKLDEANTTIDISQFNNGLYSLEMSNDSYYSSGLIQKMQ